MTLYGDPEGLIVTRFAIKVRMSENRWTVFCQIEAYAFKNYAPSSTIAAKEYGYFNLEDKSHCEFDGN